MNKLKELYKAISNENLAKAIQEIQEYDNTGLYGETVKNYARISGDFTDGITSTDFNLAQNMLLKEAAYRWMPEQYTVKFDSRGRKLCSCGSEPKDHEVRNFDAVWRDGDVYCIPCGGYVRSFDAG